MISFDLPDDIVVRRLETCQAAAFWAAIGQDSCGLGKHFPWVKHIDSLEAAEAMIEEGLKEHSSTGFAWVGIWQRDALLGVVHFSLVDKWNLSVELGYWLIPSARGCGLMTKVINGVLDKLLADTLLNRFVITTASSNLKARRVAERCGFRFEGTLREAWNDEGAMRDASIYSLIRNDRKAGIDLGHSGVCNLRSA